MTSLTKNNSESIFDAIKHLDDDGIEFWYARELMVMLGYKTWQKFEDGISRAQFACQNSKASIDEHFQFLPESVRIGLSGKGRLGNDFKLTRYACYLIAMNGDPRKIEIALAQSYFAVKVHEAETIIPVQSEALLLAELRIKELEMQNAVLDKQLALRQLDDSMLKMHGAPTVLALRGQSDQVVEIDRPTVEVLDEKSGAHFKGMTLAKINEFVAKKYGIKHKSGAEIARFIQKSGNGHLIGQIPRRQLTDYVPEENIDEVIKLLISDHRQLLLGE